MAAAETATTLRTDSDRLRFWIFFLTTTMVALAFAFVWYFSPLGLGFQHGPGTPETKRLAINLFLVSYLAGIPVLLFGQVLSVVLWFFRRTRAAYIAPLLSIGSFLLSAGAAMFVFFSL